MEFDTKILDDFVKQYLKKHKKGCVCKLQVIKDLKIYINNNTNNIIDFRTQPQKGYLDYVWRRVK